MREGEPIAGTIQAIKVALEKINRSASSADALTTGTASDIGADSIRPPTQSAGVFPQYGEPYVPWTGNAQVYAAPNDGPASAVNDAYGLGVFEQGGMPAFNMGGEMDVSALNLEEFFSLPPQYQPAWMQHY